MMGLDVAIFAILHVIAAALWFGMVFYHRIVLLPILDDDPEAGANVLRRMIEKRSYGIAMQGAAGMTVFAGLILYGIGRFWEQGLITTYGILLHTSAVLGLIAFFLTTFGYAPVSPRIKNLAVDRTPPGKSLAEDNDPTYQRLIRLSTVVLFLLTAAMFLMLLAPRV